jgi:hypothetical protein
MAGIEETAINGFVPVFRPLRSVRVGCVVAALMLLHITIVVATT